jgi:small subunit ribosomal protein S14
MKKSIEKDLKKREVFYKNEKQKKILKSITYNLKLNDSLRSKAARLLTAKPRNSSLVRKRNRCILTGRSRFLIGGYNLSRLMFRKIAGDGQIPGLRKSSW